MAVYLPNVAQTTLGASQQLISIVASATMGITLVLVFVGVSRFSQRVERVQRTAQALQHGHASAERTCAPMMRRARWGLRWIAMLTKCNMNSACYSNSCNSNAKTCYRFTRF
ncbi:MAG UNVERIFIED_CONTAM: hypothetical protein LVT10_04930 [Anaerolineae bacterium]